VKDDQKWRSYDQQSEVELFANLCRESFWEFLRWGFGVANYMEKRPENRWCVERVHRPLCEWFEDEVRDWLANRETRRTPKKLMVVWPRGMGKTTIMTKAGQLWVQLQDPDISSITDSVTTEKSWEFLQALKDVMGGKDPNAWFTQMYGSWKDPKRTWKSGMLVHAFRRSMGAEAASMISSSVEKGITGKHPDVIFIDDPVVQEKLTQEMNWLDKVNVHVNALIPALKPNGLLVATATRYHDDDWLGRYIREEGVKKVWGMMPRDWDFRLRPKDGQWDLYFLRAEDGFGNPVCPEIHTAEFLANYKAKSPLDYSAQMMNEPGQGEHMPLTREQVHHMWVEPQHVPGNLSISIHCDTAWKTRETMAKGDYNVIQVWGHARDGSGEVYYLDGYRSNLWRVEDFGDQLVMVLQRLKKEGRRPFVITDEAGLGGKADVFGGLVQGWCAGAGMYSPPVVLLNRQGRRKEIRIREAAAYWADGKVRLVRGAPCVQELVSEMLRIGVSAHDDMADAAADVFHPDIYIPERAMGRDEETPPPRRPFDDVLQTDPRRWGDGDWRVAYDEMVEREMEAALEGR